MQPPIRTEDRLPTVHDASKGGYVWAWQHYSWVPVFYTRVYTYPCTYWLPHEAIPNPADYVYPCKPTPASAP